MSDTRSGAGICYDLTTGDIWRCDTPIKWLQLLQHPLDAGQFKR